MSAKITSIDKWVRFRMRKFIWKS
ncbi:hypothetical protein ACYSNX_12720 [Myroides sp. LJL115]